jgi:hypothetical protein
MALAVSFLHVSAHRIRIQLDLWAFTWISNCCELSTSYNRSETIGDIYTKGVVDRYRHSPCLEVESYEGQDD